MKPPRYRVVVNRLGSPAWDEVGRYRWLWLAVLVATWYVVSDLWAAVAVQERAGTAAG